MRLSTVSNLMLSLCICSAPPLVRADEITSFTPAEFVAERAQIVKDIDAGVRYMEISSADKGSVLAALGRIGEVVANEPDGTPVSEAALLRIQEDRTLVSTLLAKAERDSALRCKMSASTGSNIIKRRCQTYAKLMQRIQDDRRGSEQARRRFSPIQWRGSGQ